MSPQSVLVNNWENIPRQTNISIRDQTLLQGPRWWEELTLAKYSESGPAVAPALQFVVRVVVSAGYQSGALIIRSALLCHKEGRL